MALRPAGGSMVDFSEFYKTLAGKALVGIEVSQSLNSGWVVSGVKLSQTVSSYPIQLSNKWQFYSKTQPPYPVGSFASLIIFIVLFS